VCDLEAGRPRGGTKREGTWRGPVGGGTLM